MHKLMEREGFDIQKVEAFLSFYTTMGEGQFVAFTIYHFASCILMFGQKYGQLSKHLHTISAAKYIDVCIVTLHLYRKHKTHLDCDSIQN